MVALFSLPRLALCQTTPQSQVAMATQPTIVGARANEGGTQIELPTGCQLYVYGMTTGGRQSSPFANGQKVSVTDASGAAAAELCVTTERNNGFTTETAYHVIAGFGVSGFRYAQGYYSTNPGPSANSVELEFTLVSPALVAVVGTASSQQDLTFSGLPNLVVDVPCTRSEAMSIGHTYLGPGRYKIQEASRTLSAGQTPSYQADLLGVLVFSGQPSAVTSSNQSIPIPVFSNSAPAGPMVSNTNSAMAITDVTFSGGIGRDMRIGIKGFGFGTSPVAMPYTGLFHFHFGDNAVGHGLEAGNNGDAISLRYRSWDDNEIIIDGFAGSYGVGTWWMSPGDPVNIIVFNDKLGQRAEWKGSLPLGSSPALSSKTIGNTENAVSTAFQNLQREVTSAKPPVGNQETTYAVSANSVAPNSVAPNETGSPQTKVGQPVVHYVVLAVAILTFLGLVIAVFKLAMPCRSSEKI